MEVFGDFHIHIGRASNGKPIKITASRNLTFENIVYESVERKGLDIIGIIDCASPYVIEDIEKFLENNEAYEQEKGGIIYKDKICVLLGSEVEIEEIREDGTKGLAHNICFFKYLKDIKRFSKEMTKYIKNITLSTQHSKLSAKELVDVVVKFNGIVIPAHIFTPFKSYYGNCTDSLKKVFKENMDHITCVELGLSADTEYADRIKELRDKVFLTNSDAHSLPKIAREYNLLEMEDISFDSFVKVIKGNDNKNRVIKNFGMNPTLGKYNTTYCDNCNKLSDIKVIEEVKGTGKNKKLKKINTCVNCGSKKVVKGVINRIEEITKEKSKSNKKRSQYVYQVPIEFLPKIGKKTLEKLLDHYGTEMNLLHRAKIEDIKFNFGEVISETILRARKMDFEINKGGRWSLR